MCLSRFYNSLGLSVSRHSMCIILSMYIYPCKCMYVYKLRQVSGTRLRKDNSLTLVAECGVGVSRLSRDSSPSRSPLTRADGSHIAKPRIGLPFLDPRAAIVRVKLVPWVTSPSVSLSPSFSPSLSLWTYATHIRRGRYLRARENEGKRRSARERGRGRERQQQQEEEEAEARLRNYITSFWCRIVGKRG